MSNDFLLSPEPSGAKRTRSPRLEILNRDIGIRQRRPRGLASEELRRALASLEEMIVDPSVPEEMLADYISVQPLPGRRPFAHFALHEEIDAALAEDNRDKRRMLRNIKEFCRQRRQAQFRRRYHSGENRPVLISDGDSWFHFPVFLRDVIMQLSHDHLVWPLANAGDTLKHMVYGAEATRGQRYVGGLRDYGREAKAFLFSAGGNDLIGVDPSGLPALLSYVRPHERGRSAAWHIDTPEFRRRLSFIEGALRHVLADVAARRPNLPVLIHGYDYALPCPWGMEDRRNPQWTSRDHFLGAAARHLGIHEPHMQRAIARCVIDAINTMQRRLAGGNVEGGAFPHVYHVDVRDTMKPDEWADEIHPTNSGYARVANHFRRVLSDIGVRAA
jgi:hypothetical protein